MKLLVPALLLSTTICSFCQSTPQKSVDPDQLFKMPHQYQLAPREFGKPLSFRAWSQFTFLPRVIRPSQAPKVGNPHLDAEIIHRPLRGNFAVQEPRTPIASNIYPDLKLLPVETARLDAAPTE